jgi:N-acetylneuraminate epimerase
MRWKIAAQLPPEKGQAKAPGLAGPVAGMYANKLIIGGGANFPDSMPWLGGKKKYYDDLYVYAKKGKEFVLMNQAFKLPTNLAYAASCSTEKGIVISGGENEKGISNAVFLVKWNEKDKTIVVENLPELPVAATNAAAVAVGSNIYVAGGETNSGVSDQFHLLDLNDVSSGWKQLPSLPKPVSHTVLTVQNNSKGLAIYAAGGRRKKEDGISDLSSSLFEFDLQKNDWITKNSLPYALSAGTGIATGSGYLVIFGGDKGEVFHKTEELIAAINKETNAAKREVLNKEKIYLQSTHPGFSKDVLLYDTIKDEWKTIERMPFEAPVTTTAISCEDGVLIPGGEIKAGIRTPNVWQGKIKISR